MDSAGGASMRKAESAREQFINWEFRQQLEEALHSHRTIDHPLLQELGRPVKNSILIRLIALQGYQLTKNFAWYVGALYHHCPIAFYRKRLAVNLYEEETGKLSKTANHEVLMQRFIRALGISDAERDEAAGLPTTQELIDYRWRLVNDPATFHMGAAAIMIASEGQNLEETAGKARHELLPTLYGLQPKDLAFFSVHAVEDIYHVREGLDLVAEICTTPAMQAQALEAVHETCKRFWDFYDGIQAEYERISTH